MSRTELLTESPDPVIEEELDATASSEVEGDEEGDLVVEKDASRVSIEKADRSLRELHTWYREQTLKMDPEWQRNFVWEKKRSAKLIESFLLDIPVPVIYLAATKQNTYEVIDGVQRLTSVFNFFEDNYALSGLEILPDLNDKKFSQLDDSTKRKLHKTTVRTFELSPETSKSLLFVIFERLNRGGLPLKEMEIRNCIYRGKLNDLLKKLAKNTDFVKAASQKNLDKRMQDRALVLRFLAFYEKGYKKAQKGLKQFLNDFCQVYQNVNEDKLAEFEAAFKKASRAALTIFGENAFRLRKLDKFGSGQWTTSLNASVYQVLMTSFCDYDAAQITQASDAILEEYLDLISSDIQWVDSVRASTGDPSKITYAFETWNERLKTLLSSVAGLDSQRVFTNTFKKELFDANPQCALCNQTIRSIHDAAVDHMMHYWRGGQTIPTNGRLSHRLCNQKRAK